MNNMSHTLLLETLERNAKSDHVGSYAGYPIRLAARPGVIPVHTARVLRARRVSAPVHEPMSKEANRSYTQIQSSDTVGGTRLIPDK